MRNLKFFFILFFLATSNVFASQSSGTIDATSHYARVCQDVSCSVGGLINFLPTTGVGITAITVDDTNGIDGHAWGTELGWINFSPSGGGVTFSDTSTGSTTGYAWSPVSGWINFGPTGYGVKINTSGEFQGYAWTSGQNGGWIKFDCTSGVNYCVKTDWRPVPARTITPGGGGGGGGGSIVSSTAESAIVDNSKYLNQGGTQSQPTDYSSDFRSDINDSGLIDILDYNQLMVGWGKTAKVDSTKSKIERCASTIAPDVNCDGSVNLLDFNLVMVYWNAYVGEQGRLLQLKVNR